MIALVGRGGLIGCEDSLPVVADREMAGEFQQRVLHLCEGGIAIMGGRTFENMQRMTGWHPRDAPFDVFVWDREAQARSGVDATVEALTDQGTPVFVVGGRYTFECFMPWVEQFFITRTALTLDGPPLYMPDLFGTTQ